MLLAAAGCAVAFGVLLLLAYYAGPARWLDTAALNGLTTLGWRPRIGELANTLAHLSDPAPFAICVVALLATALVLHRPRHAAAAAVLLVGANVSSQVLKAALAHPRPMGEFVDIRPIADAAFPSGHTTASMSIALAALLIAPAAFRPLVAVAGGVWTLAVSLSLLILNWHLPSDVVGGQLLATGWGLVALAGLRAAAERWPEKGTIREVARASLPTPSHATLGLTAAAVAMVGAAALAARADGIAAYAHAHTTAVAVVAAITASAAALLAGVTALAARRP